MTPKVMIILGSASDMKIAEKSMDVLDKLEIPYSLKIASAHRTPDLLRSIVRRASNAGVRVFIGIAGLAAHLPGFIASHTPRPVIGVPVDVKTKGIDALESIVQMPYPSPIATVGIDRGDNAAILAAQFLGVHDEKINEKVRELRKEYADKVVKSNELVDEIKRPYLDNNFLRFEDIGIYKIEKECEVNSKNLDAEVVILVGRQNDVGIAKKVSVILQRLKISHDLKVLCPIRSSKKFRAYVKSMKNAKIFISVSSNSSLVTGGLVGLTSRPIISVPCTNENNENYILTSVNMPPGVPAATVGTNNGKNAAVLAGEILSIYNDGMVEVLEKLKDKKINL